MVIFQILVGFGPENVGLILSETIGFRMGYTTFSDTPSFDTAMFFEVFRSCLLDDV